MRLFGHIWSGKAFYEAVRNPTFYKFIFFVIVKFCLLKEIEHFRNAVRLPLRNNEIPIRKLSCFCQATN